MSAPEAKASRPAPRYTTARTEWSLASDSVTFAISPHMARLTALRTLGRLKTTVAIPPSRSTRISSLIPLLLVSFRMCSIRPYPRARQDRRWPYRNRSHEPAPKLRDGAPLVSLRLTPKVVGVVLYLLGYSSRQ